MSDVEVLRELWRITKIRGGAVLEAEYVEDRWTGYDVQPPERHFWVAKSSSFTGKTIRVRKEGP